MAEYRWDSGTRRYRGADGRFLSAHEVRFRIDDSITAAAERMGELSGRLQSRTITIAEWQRGMRDAVKDIHLCSAASARGGWHQMSAADYGRAGGRVRQQYAYLARFAAQLQSGDQPLNGRVPVRAGMYAHAARATYEETRRRGEQDGGMEQERRITHSWEGCTECAALTAMGWQPIGTLPPIGTQICRVNCLCTFEYRKAPSISL